MPYLIFLLPSLFILSLFTSYTVKAKNVDPQWEPFVKDYGRYVEKKLTSKGIPGAALSIVNTESADYIKAFGRTKSKHGLVVNQHTRFRLASVSKTFAGTLAAKLATQGVFAIDDPVSEYITDFGLSRYKNELKIYHLLSHSSGLVPNAYDNLIESRTAYPKIVKQLLNVEPICRPSQCYGYQNVMFSVIGDVIKSTTGEDYAYWLNESIFKPLQMNNASVGYDNMTQDDNYAHPHVRGKTRWYTAKLKNNYYKVPPAAGVNASASDMAIWLKAQLGQYPDVLSLDTLSAQTRTYTHTKKEKYRRVWRKKLKDAYYGLGWRIYDYDDETIFYHSGWVQGYRSDLVIFPHLNIGFSLILNAETGLINELTTEFVDKVLAYKRGN
ncbi:beta-lactamase family protein [Pseudoalteromonas sp. MMG010]|uniref:serine hydrolase domain-containing protein n=1 Tax=Pseudoalteromonas sp. MMG010 TaxID=2822685 RepID=UPI001B3A2066|nr:serine hydrolase domain-containing protein [Pseudoalteromonas sp. MMG010]MBQ4831719.1 beta-lactamase family protein [Pseudoalteromonas sp. MMG010]